MKLSAPPPPPPPSDGPPGAGPPAPDEQPNPNPAPATPSDAAPAPPVAPGPAPAPKPASWPTWYSGVDSALVGLVVALAFASASFVARNSDAFVNLAAGKRLFAGEYFPGGGDPLSYSAEGRTWVNHSWLTDAFAYLLYGGTGQVLVIAKALLVALAFGLLIAIRRPNFSLWPWAAVACVGVLACAPQFTLRPLVVSMLLLASTLFILFRMPHKKDPRRFLVAIGATFWVWANCDQWFFVGPLALALLVIGDLIQKYGFNAPDEPLETPDDEPLGRLPDVGTLAKALGVGVLACTLTPHHVRIWELPFELTGVPGADADPRLRQLLLGPTDNVYSTNAALGYNLNGLAYVVLFTAGAVIFGLGPARVRIGHVALWIGFAALSLLSIYTIPFFAIVAVPLVAAQLNAFSAKAQLKTLGDPRTRLLLAGSSAGRVLCVVGVCALGVLAYPGWVHPDAQNPVYARRIAWGVEPDPGLVKAAEQFKEWRAAGGLPDDARGFVTSTDLANYIAWYAPKEKVFVNGRIRHHRPELPDYLAVRKGLGLIRTSEDEPDLDAATAVLKARGAEYVAVQSGAADNQGLRFLAQLVNHKLLQQWGQWSVWYVDGRTTVYGWRGTGAGKPSFEALALDPVAQAFGPGVAKVPAPELTQPLKEVDPLVEAFGRAPKPAPAGAAEALGWLDYKEALVARHQFRQRLTGVLFFQGPAVQNTFHQTLMITAEARGLTRFPARGATPEAAEALRAEAEATRATPFLAVRAARRAIAEDPDHPDAYFALAQALSDPDLPLSEGERALGMITAYRQCLIRLPKPDRYKRGQFATTATDAALGLAQVYLGRRLAWRDARGKEVVEYTGFPINVAPFQGMFGQQLFGDPRTGAVSRGQPAGPNPVPLNNGTPFLLAVDLARETLQTALEYAPADLKGEADDRLKAKVKQVEDFRRDVEDVVIRYKGRYDAGRGPSTKVPALVDRALQNCMLGEALRLLSDKDTDLDKEYGNDRFVAAGLWVALELATGRLEDAAENLKFLSGPERLGALTQSKAAPLVQTLKYQKAVLAGEYKAAGDLWEAQAQGVGQFDKYPPPGPELPRAVIDNALRATSGGRDPAKVLPGLLVPPGGVVPGHFQAVQFHLWIESWDALRRVTQQVIGNQLGAEASFFYRRGVLFLLEGDIPGAKDRFKAATRKPPAGWDLPTIQSAEAEMYLRLIDRAEKKGR